MARRWMVVALMSLGLIVPGTALAQLPPGFGGAGGSPGAEEPAPIQSMPGNCTEKSLTGAPPVALTNDGTPNAFATDHVANPECGWFLGLGGVGLQRQRLGKSLLGVEDPLTDGDTGILPPLGLPALVNPKDVGSSYMWGLKATIGYRYGADSLEFTGFYLPQQSSAHDVIDPAQIDLPFAAFPVPSGFRGDNNLWLQADHVNMQLQTTLGNFEVNYRVGTGNGWEWLVGLRYIDLDERFGLTTYDDQISGNLIPQNTATYSTRAHSRIFAPQVGLEGEWPLLRWVGIGGTLKGAWGVNFASTDTSLVRGDGFMSPDRPDVHRYKAQFGHVYEGNLFLDFLATDRIKLRAGYQVLFLVNVPQAVDQIDFNLLDLQGRRSFTGSVFYHGPLIELHLLF